MAYFHAGGVWLSALRPRSGVVGLAWAGLVLALTSGCTTVSITEAGGSVRVERHFGVVSIQLAPATSALLAETRSLGWFSGPQGLVLGVADSRVAALPPECRLVVWLEHPTQFEALQRQLGEKRELCVINSGGPETGAP